MRSFAVPNEFEHYRLDQFLAKKLPKLSRSLIQKIVKLGKVKVNGVAVLKVSRQVLGKDEVEVDMPAPKVIEAAPEEIELDILFEDKDLIVVNKPAGMVVHPAQGHSTGTLVNALLHHCTGLKGIGGAIRPGIVHRLDKETSGIMVIAKNDISHQRLSKGFKDRAISKRYIAIVHGILKDDIGVIDAPIGRSQSDRKKMAVIRINSEKEAQDHARKHRKVKTRDSVTHFKVLKRGKDRTLVELRPETGRTHQIRVHLAHIHHPIIGDKVYGYKKDNAEVMALHSCLLGFNHPRTGEYMEFKRYPEWMKEIIE